jgi:FkbM family methyltransferase
MTTLGSLFRWKWGPRLRRHLYQAQLGLFRALANILPGMSRVALRNAINVKCRMDYAKKDIYLNVGSWVEYDKRLKSCAKEPETVAWIEGFIMEGDVVYDIGANVGAYSLLIAKRLNGKGRVYAFEPSFSTFAQLCGNIALNDCSQTVSPMYLALSDKTAIEDFKYTSIDAGTALHGLGQNSAVAGVVYQQQMISYSLDELIGDFALEPPNHIKLDVDGIEYGILKGAAATLADRRLRTVIVETEDTRDGSGDIAGLLLKAGFELHSQHPHNQNPFHSGPYVRNCLFVRTG